MSDAAPVPAIRSTTRRAYYAPTAGRHYFSKGAAYNNEAKARFYSRCDCEQAEYEDGYCTAPALICDLHVECGRYTTRRESDGTTLTGRIIRRWARLLATRDRGPL